MLRAKVVSGEISEEEAVQMAAVQMWPTPNVVMIASKRGKQARYAAGHGGANLAEEVGGTLNPMWVEWLQGYPSGWTEV